MNLISLHPWGGYALTTKVFPFTRICYIFSAFSQNQIDSMIIL